MDLNLKNILTHDDGAVYAEYALLAVLIAVAAVGAVAFFGDSVHALWEASLQAIIEIFN